MNKMIKNVKRKFDIVAAKTTLKTLAIFDSCAAAVAGATGYSEVDIKSAITKSLNIVFAVVAFGGIVNIVTGVAALAKGAQDDGCGQDAAAMSKGRGKLIAGVIMVAPVGIITLITGGSPADIVTSYL